MNKEELMAKLCNELKFTSFGPMTWAPMKWPGWESLIWNDQDGHPHAIVVKTDYRIETLKWLISWYNEALGTGDICHDLSLPYIRAEKRGIDPAAFVAFLYNLHDLKSGYREVATLRDFYYWLNNQ